MQRLGVIDIGTNTILMLVCDVDAHGILQVIDDVQRFARLGRRVDAERSIQQDAFDRCAVILDELRRRAEAHGVDRIITTGTSALRDARNREHFISEMQQRAGLRIEVLSGSDESALTFAGATSMGDSATDRRYAVLDIGGGSTELALGRRGIIEHRASLDIGCVRMTEQHLHHDPPLPSECRSLHAALADAVQTFPLFAADEVTFVAAAGTALSLAAIDRGSSAIDDPALEGHRLSRTRIHALRDALQSRTHAAIVSELHVDPGRADILLAGVMILEAVMDARGIVEVHVTGRGLRYGIALREIDHIPDMPR